MVVFLSGCRLQSRRGRADAQRAAGPSCDGGSAVGLRRKYPRMGAGQAERERLSAASRAGRGIRTDVTIENILIGGTPRSFSYSVTVFDRDVAPGIVLSFAPIWPRCPIWVGPAHRRSRSVRNPQLGRSKVIPPGCTIASPVSGRGDAVVTFAADPNPNAAPRTATLTSSAARLSITQSGTPCTYTFQPSAGVAARWGRTEHNAADPRSPDCSSVYSLSPGLRRRALSGGRNAVARLLCRREYRCHSTAVDDQHRRTDIRHRSGGPACLIREHAEQLRNLSGRLPLGSRKEWKETI